jgi:hypothetical protein
VRECEKRVEREEEEKEEEGQEVGAGQALAYHPPPVRMLYSWQPGAQNVESWEGRRRRGERERRTRESRW